MYYSNQPLAYVPLSLINVSKRKPIEQPYVEANFQKGGCEILLQLCPFCFRDYDSLTMCQGCHTAVRPPRVTETWQTNGVLIIGCRECAIVEWSVAHQGLKKEGNCIVLLAKWHISVNSSDCGHAEWDKPWYCAHVLLYFHFFQVTLTLLEFSYMFSSRGDGSRINCLFAWLHIYWRLI